jgi:hypothetical protein
MNRIAPTTISRQDHRDCKPVFAHHSLLGRVTGAIAALGLTLVIADQLASYALPEPAPQEMASRNTGPNPASPAALTSGGQARSVALTPCTGRNS